MKSIGVVLAGLCILTGLLLTFLVFRQPDSSAANASTRTSSSLQHEGPEESPSVARSPDAALRSTVGSIDDSGSGEESGPLEEETQASDQEQRDVLSEIRGGPEYREMSVDELDAERWRLSQLLTEESTRRASELAEQGFKIYLGASPSTISPGSIPDEYKGMITCFHGEVGVDGLYLVVLDPLADSDLYELRDACTLVSAIAHEKRAHGQ